jgi:hypothetical protein
MTMTMQAMMLMKMTGDARYFALAQEDIDLCDPLAWWYSRWKEYPHLYQLARDI